MSDQSGSFEKSLDALSLDANMIPAQKLIGPKRGDGGAADPDGDGGAKKPPGKKTVAPGAQVMTLAYTGMIQGETATITESKVMTARIRLVRGFVPPQPLPALNAAEIKSLYERVSHRRGRDFASPQAAEDFRRATGAPGSYQFLGEANLKTTLIRFLELKPKDAKLISQEDIAYLLSTDVTPWDALMRFTSSSEGSAATWRRRLVFLLKYWTLDIDQPSPPLVIIRHGWFKSPTGSAHMTLARKEQQMLDQGLSIEPYEGAINMTPDGLLVGPGGISVSASSAASSSASSSSSSSASAAVEAVKLTKAGVKVFDMFTVPPVMSLSKAGEPLGAGLVHVVADTTECYIRLAEGHRSGEDAVRDSPYAMLYEPHMRNEPEKLISVPRADELRRFLEPMSTSILKSLMQKIIRFAPHSIQLDPNNNERGLFRAENVLIWVMIVIMNKRASFNPTTGTTERGIHAVIKRVVIACIEDAWPRSAETALNKFNATELDEGTEVGVESALLFGMLQCMLINLPDLKFWPSRKELLGWIALARAAYRSRFTCIYDARTPSQSLPAPTNVDTLATQLAMTSHLLDTYVKGMGGDLLMVRFVARKRASTPRGEDFMQAMAKAAEWPRPEALVMPGWHALDQHDFPAIVYMFDPRGEVMRVTRTSPSIRTATPFADLFGSIFKNITGLNARRENLGTTDLYGRGTRMSPVGSNYIDEVVAAQRMVWRILLRGEGDPDDPFESGRNEADPRRRYVPKSSSSSAAAAAAPVDGPSPMDADLSLDLTLPFEWLAYAFSTREHSDRVGKKTQVYMYNISPSDNDLHMARKDARTSKAALGKAVRTVGSGTEEALRLEQETARIKEDIVQYMLATPAKTAAGTFVASDALMAPSGMIYCERDADTGSLLFKVSPDGVAPAVAWTESFPISLQVSSVDLSTVPLRPGNFPEITRFAYLSSVVGWDPLRTVAKIREAVDSAGVSASAILDAVARLRSFSKELNFPQPGRDGGASDDEIPSFMGYEVCQVAKIIAAFCPPALRPMAYEGRARPNRFVTDQSHLMLRRFLGSVIDPSLRTTSIADLMQERVRPLIGDRRFNALLRNMRNVWRSSQQQQLWLHQQQCIERYLVRANYQRRRHHFMNLPPGSGKTDIAAAIFKGLLVMHKRRAPNADDVSDDGDEDTPLVGVQGSTDGMFMLLATTGAALDTVASLVSLIMGASKVIVLNRSRTGAAFEMPRTFRAGYVYVTKHDLLRDHSDDLMEHMPRCFFCVDEVHMATGKTTKRTDRMLLLSRVSMYTLAMTGTPLRSKRDESTLRRWIQLGTRFPCRTAQDFMVALSDVIQYPVVTDVSYDDEGNEVNVFVQIATTTMAIDATLRATEQELATIWSNVPASAGGNHQAARFSNAMFTSAYRDSRRVCTRQLLDDCVAIVLNADQAAVRPFLVAENQEHLNEMYASLASRIPPAKIWAFGISDAGSRTIPLGLLSTPSQYRVCLMVQSVNTGYSATWFNRLMRCVYPSNAASREQMEGRLVRPGQTVSPVPLHTYHAGITTLMLKHHIDASNFNKMMRELNGIVNALDDE